MSEMLKIESAALRLEGAFAFPGFQSGGTGRRVGLCDRRVRLRQDLAAACGVGIPPVGGRTGICRRGGVDGAYGGAYPETHGLRASGTVPSG